MSEENKDKIKSTTVIAVAHKDEIAIGADGQATLGSAIVKSTVQKIRSLLEGQIHVGFAGSPSDALILLERLEVKLNAKGGNLYRALLALAKEWRTDRYLRKLESMMVIIDQEQIFVLTGSGDVMRPDHDIAAVGSGSSYAQAAAHVLKKHASHLTATQIIEESLHAAADICIYTNHNLVVKKLQRKNSQEA